MKLILPNHQIIELDCPANFHLPRVLSKKGLSNYEPVTLCTALSAAELSDGIFIDIGANIGVYALSVSSATRSFCYAFEPFPDAYNVLSKAVSSYKLPISVFDTAVSACAGEASFYLSDRSDMSHSLNSSFRNHTGTLNVAVTTIDKICVNIKPGVIKIDAETAEQSILEGARNTIIRDRPYILLEILGDDLESYVTDYFSDLDYYFYRLGDKSFQQKIISIAPTDNKDDSRNCLLSPISLNDSFYQTINKWSLIVNGVSNLQQELLT